MQHVAIETNNVETSHRFLSLVASSLTRASTSAMFKLNSKVSNWLGLSEGYVSAVGFGVVDNTKTSEKIKIFVN